MSPVDVVILVAYLCIAIGIGLAQKKVSHKNKEQFFLAGRQLPWWLAGISIAATTFAADTPLAVTGIIAAKGISGNWLWLAWIGMHCGMVVFFARYWSRAGTLTDAELYSLRYEGKSAEYLRLFRSLLSGLVINVVVLGWVIKAMVKICHFFLPWQEWFPGFFSFMSQYWPVGLPIGGLSEALTIIGLIVLVAIYSSFGGLRGVVYTDLLQFAIAMAGSIWLAVEVLNYIGGMEEITRGMVAIYGETGRFYLELFPNEKLDWVQALEFTGGMFAIYLFVQSLSNINADGAGYIMQRLNATPSDRDAQKASLVFVVVHYLLRVWPWFIVAMGALVIIPLGSESEVFSGTAAAVAADRELAYPFLMKQLLQPGIMGLVFASLVAAFMSTIDTHMNWGASYFVNDWYLRLRPKAEVKEQVRMGRIGVFFFMAAAIAVSFYIDTVEQGWKWVATVGASFGVPSVLRWFWWRMTATSEIVAVVSGLLMALVCELFFDVKYEWRLLFVFAASCCGLVIGTLVSRANSMVHTKKFYSTVRPLGWWPGVPRRQMLGELTMSLLAWMCLLFSVICLLWFGVDLMFSNWSGDLIVKLGTGVMLSLCSLYILRRESATHQEES